MRIKCLVLDCFILQKPSDAQCCLSAAQCWVWAQCMLACTTTPERPHYFSEEASKHTYPKDNVARFSPRGSSGARGRHPDLEGGQQCHQILCGDLDAFCWQKSSALRPPYSPDFALATDFAASSLVLLIKIATQKQHRNEKKPACWAIMAYVPASSCSACRTGICRGHNPSKAGREGQGMGQPSGRSQRSRTCLGT